MNIVTAWRNRRCFNIIEKTWVGQALFCIGWHSALNSIPTKQSINDYYSAPLDVEGSLAQYRRQVEANVLRKFAEHDLHGLIPFCDISDRMYHSAIDRVQEEALDWAILREEEL